MRRFVAILAVLVLATLTSVTLAKKGGGKPGGGGDPPSYTVAYADPAGSRVSVMTADGRTIERLTNYDVFNVNWHPDGGQLIVTSNVNGPGVYVVDLAGNTTKLFETVYRSASFAQADMSATPSPTGHRLIAYIDDQTNGMRAVWVRNEDGSNPVEILPLEVGRMHLRVAFHPNGDSIALETTLSGEPNEIWLLELGSDTAGNATVTSITPLTSLPGLEGVSLRGPVFSNAGDRLAVTTGSDIYFIDMSSPNDVTNVTYGRVTWPGRGCWDAADDTFYFSAAGPRNSNIFTVDSSGNITDIGSRNRDQRNPSCAKP